MTNQAILSMALVICSLGGWYVVLHKYYSIRAFLRKAIDNTRQDMSEPKASDIVEQDTATRNLACVLHVSGFVLCSGVLLANVIVPLVLWLLNKEKSNFIAEHGRRVVNFQLSIALLQILALCLGALLFSVLPATAAELLRWTKTWRVVFNTGMYMPFNMFSLPVVLFAIVQMLRGAVSSYQGRWYQYPALPFIMAREAIAPQPPRQNPKTVAPQQSSRVSFG